MAEIETLEHEAGEERPFKFGRSRFGKFGGNGGRANGGVTGGVKRFFSNIERRVSKFGVLEYTALAAVGILTVDHLIAPKGASYLSKLLDKIGFGGGGGHRAALPPPPPPPIPAAPKVGWYEMPWYPEMLEEHAAAGDYAGANLQAGWNRGMSPYGPWAAADPMAQYAHAAQRQRTGHHGWFDWENE